MKRRFYVKIILELHAVTCPGVWLCTSGYLELTIKSLGYFFRSGPMEPRFPMLCHDIFTMEGYFSTVRNFNELNKTLAMENIEVALWQNGCRLSYFIGKLKQIISNAYTENTKIQILMNPSHNFPGIIAPKLEFISHVYFENRTQLNEIHMTPERFTQMHEDHDHFVPNKTIQTEPDPRSPEYRIQRPVCHTKLMKDYKLQEKNKLDWRIPESCRKCTTIPNYKINERRLSKDTIPSLKFSESPSHSSTRGDTTNSVHSSNLTHNTYKDSAEHFENCDVCKTYEKTFRMSE